MPLTPDQLRDLARAFPIRGASRHDATGYETLRTRIVEAIRPFARGLEFDLDEFDPDPRSAAGVELALARQEERELADCPCRVCKLIREQRDGRR